MTGAFPDVSDPKERIDFEPARTAATVIATAYCPIGPSPTEGTPHD